MTRITTAAVLTLVSLAAVRLDARTATATFLSPSSSNPAFGSALTLTATVVDTGGSGVVTSGGVTFYDGAAVLGSGSVTANSTATLVTRNLSPGAHALSARYQGTTTYAPSASTNQIVTVSDSAGAGFGVSLVSAGGVNPQAIAYGDFNGDGITDLATANFGSNNVSVFLGVGDGTFAAAVTYATGTGPASIAVADVNLDGFQDIVVVNQTAATLSVLTGLGNGTFNAAIPIATAPHPVALAIADFNGDGLPDVVVSSASGLGSNNEIAVQLNTGAPGLFAAPVTVTLPGTPVGLVVGELNSDGLADVAVVNTTALGVNYVSVLLGNGAGSFAAPANYAVGSGPVAVAVGDFNNDGRQDLAVANSSGNSVSILLNVGSGAFATAVSYPAGATPSALVISDFNGDGDLDIAVTDQAGANVTKLMGTGTGTFQAAASSPVGTAPSAILAASFNGDAIVDLAVANGADSTVSVLIGAGSATALTASPNPAAPGAAVTLTATVTPSTATGTVSFSDINGLIGTAPVVAGVATLATSTLPTGSDSLIATYTGNLGTSTSPPYLEVIGTSSSVVVSAVPSPAAFGSPVTLTATVSNGSAGTVTFYMGASAVIGEATVTGGVATLVTTQLPAGTYTITARYSGDASHLPAVSPAITLTVNAAPGGGFPPTSPAVPVGQSPDAVVSTDLNKDGNTDLVVANYAANNLSVLLGAGNGAFTAAPSVAVGANPVALAYADFNLDGNQDLVVSNNGSNNVTVLLGNGDGTFQAGTTLAAGSGPVGVVAGDFNADGIPDFAVAVSNAGQIAVYLGVGNGTFQTPLMINMVDGLRAIAAGDFNADGKMDLAVTSGNGVYVLLGNGDGTFGAPVSLATGLNPDALAATDLNGDGRSDLIVVNGDLNTITVLLSIGSGQFAPPVNYATGSFPQGIAISDFNGDGKLDAAVINSASGTVSLFYGNGDGTLQPAISYSAGPNPYAIAAGSFTASGRADLAVAQYSANTVGVLLALQAAAVTLTPSPNPDPNAGPVTLTATLSPSSATGTVTFFDGTANLGSAPVTGGVATLTPVTFSTGLHDLTADYSGDGAFGASISPVVVESVGQTPTTTTLTASPNATILGKPVTLTATVSNSAAVGFITFYDGATVLGQSAVSGGVATLTTTLLPSGVQLLTARFDGNGASGASLSAAIPVTITPNVGFSLAAPLVVPAGTTPTWVALSDFNGDGKTDLAVTNSAGVAVLTGSGTGTFTAGPTLPAGTNPAQVIAADFNGDGRMDLAVSNSGSGNISILLSNGSGSFDAAVNYAAGASPTGIVAADFNNDGYVDLAVSNSGGGVSVLLGNGNGTFNTATRIAVGGTNVGIVAGDFNNDGNADLAVIDNANNVVWILLGNGVGGFTVGSSFPTGIAPSMIAVGDLNSDGKLDLAIANSGSPNVSVLLGNGDGTFQPQALFATGANNAGIAIADLNGGGTPDLAVTTQTGAVVVLIGTGTGAFASPAPFSVGSTGLGALAIGNFNGDGAEQVAVVNPSANAVDLLLDGPATLQIVAGNSQTTATGTTFATPLQVSASGYGVPAPGVPVTFTAPATGASGSFAGSGPTGIFAAGSNGIVTAPAFTANGIAGSYAVAASVGTSVVDFTLTNSSSSGCTFTVTPASGIVPVGFVSGGGSAVINVIASAPACPWSASAEAGFIALSSTGGTGNGSVTVTVGPNTSGVELSAAVLIAGQSIPVVSDITPAQIFADVPPGAFDFDAVNLLYGKGVTSGCATNPLIYCPGDSITRAQMAVLLVKAIFNGTTDFTPPPNQIFSDVPPTAFGYAEIQEMFALGLTTGCGSGMFCPDEVVSRDQMAVFITKMRYGQTFDYQAAPPIFTDVPATYGGYPEVQRLAQDGITTGCSNTLFCPTAPVTRGQMAIFLMRGAFNELLLPGIPYVSTISPATFIAGGPTVTVTATGVNTSFTQGATAIGPVAGVTFSNLTVTSPTTLTVDVAVAANVAIQPYPFLVITGAQEALLPNGLFVTPLP